MIINDRYSNNYKKSYCDMTDTLDEVVEFNINEKYSDVEKKINGINVANNRVWLLFGLDEAKEWECLQVAQTKNKLLTEMIEDVRYMFLYNYPDLLSSIPDNKRIVKNSAFYNEIYWINADAVRDNNEKRKYLYSKIASEYECFKICFLNVDRYLGLSEITNANENIVNMLAIAKALYAEAMVAYDTLAKYWNMYNSGIDGQAVMIFLEQGRNKKGD